MNTRPASSQPAMTCGMCGASFDPSEHVACSGCPFQSGCQLVCCPVCGYEMVDPQRSALARLFSRFLRPVSSDVDAHSVQRNLPR